MEPLKRQNKKGPEKIIEDDIVKMLRNKGWLVRKMHGDANNKGWPDLYACHSNYGIRWIEVKLPQMKGSKFTPAQREWFPKLVANGSRIWILVAATESEYKKLFEEPNFYQYWIMKHV